MPQGGDPVVCWYPLNKGIGEIARTPLLPYYRAPLLPLYHTTAGNFLVDAYDALYIIDWDNPILAPKEHDLIFIDGAQGFRGYSAQEEEILFYRGYGQMQIDPIALGIIALNGSSKTLRSTASSYYRPKEAAKIESNPFNI